MSSPGYPVNTTLAGRRDQMFPSLDPRVIARLADHARKQTFEAGALVWEQGDNTVPFYVVLDGQLEVVHPESGVEQPVTIHQRGEFTGEMALLFGRRTLVRARAKTRLSTLSIEPQRFRALVQTEPEFGETVMRAFIL